MDKEVIKKLEKIEKELIATKEQILTELAVYNNKFDSNLNALIVQNQVLKSRIDKYFNYKNYFDKLNNCNQFSE
ncbi:MAG: hypothetical protein J6A04_03740 [Clostridia bacterium]|nr:hypothetical protein [Clostridia bacterium]